MGIIRGWMGHLTNEDAQRTQKEFADLLVNGEEVLLSYKYVRDRVVLTTHRLIRENIQGITGKRKSYLSIPYSKIRAFAKQSAGWLDLDAEVWVWLLGQEDPIQFDFKRTKMVNEFLKILGEGVLQDEFSK